MGLSKQHINEKIHYNDITQKEQAKMMKKASFAILVALCFAHLCLGAFGDMHIRIKNELSKDMKIKVHCQDGDHGLGTQVIAKGMAIEWRIDTPHSGQYHCDVEWNELDGFHFEAYSRSRDNQQCRSVCSWHITERGPLLLNRRTGLWETMPFDPLPGEKERVASGLAHKRHDKCFCWPPKHE
ncbi:hypothetical protein L1049_007135 [Liquidambar formosana]|uniref:S-protein homolog n=1 Tax=Liquidambar formosana TaxID=63359 RepID=A0AAP0RGQ1_LIQFO